MDKNLNLFLEGFDLSEGDTVLSIKHKCQFGNRLNALMERYPGDGKRNRMLRCIMFFFITQKNFKWIKKRRKTDYEYYYDQKRQLFGPFVIHPLSIFRTSWNLIMFLVSWTILICYPILWFLSYIRSKFYEAFDIFQTYAEIFTWMDIIFNSFTTFYDDNDELCINRKEIFKHYVKRNFIIDLLVALPTSILENLFVNKATLAEKKDSKYFIYINIFYFFKILRYFPFSRYFDSICGYIIKRKTILLLFKVQISFIIFLHWNSCIVTATSALDAGIVFTGGRNKDNWLLDHNTWNSSLLLVYGHSILRAMSYMFNIHYVNTWNMPQDQDEAIGIYEMFYSSLTTILSQIVFFNYICLCTRVNKTMHSSQYKYRRLITSLQLYLDQMNFSQQIADKIMLSFRMRFCYTYFKDENFNKDFAALRCYKMLENIQLFHEFPKSALMKLASRLVSETYFPGDIIEIPSDIALLFLQHGTVAVYISDGFEFLHIEDGAYFGFTNLFTDLDQTEYNITYLCLELCIIYQLPKQIFMKIKNYSQILTKLEKEAANCKQEINKYITFEKYSRNERKHH